MAKGYEQYRQCTVEITFTTPVLGGFPNVDADTGEPIGKCRFDRANGSDQAVVPARWWRGFFRDNMRMVFGNDLHNIACNYVFAEPAILPGAPVDLAPPVSDKGHGRGLALHESFPAGTSVTVKFNVPTKPLDSKRFEELLRTGKWHGIGAKHRLDYGRFMVGSVTWED